MAYRFSKLIVLTFLVLSQILASLAVAQEEKSLKDIFDSQEKVQKHRTSKSGEELAYEYYESCFNSPDYFVTEKIQKKYCSCKAAKISESLSPKEISILSEDTKAGKAARDKMRINAESVCMLPPTKSYTYGICMKDPHFKTIIMGKSKICNCVSDYMQNYTKKNITSIIITAATEEPLSLDILSHFLRTRDFDMMYRNFKDRCYTQVIYDDVKSNQ